MIIGITTEYNPFHAGHLHQINELRQKFEDVSIIAAMSGSFTQRGEPAILDKWTRARLAVQNGVDLIFELPFIFTVRSAQDFARGSIDLLSKLGIVDAVAFGAECDNLSTLKNIAEMIDSESIQTRLHSEIRAGSSYAVAVEHSIKHAFPEYRDILNKPNNLLAVEYLRSIRKLRTNFETILIPRASADHDENFLRDGISSAKSIRDELKKSKPDWSKLSSAVDSNTLDELRKIYPDQIPNLENFFRPILMKVFSTNRSEFKNFYGFNEGLENRLINIAMNASSYENLIEQMVSKRYTRARISRLLLYLMFGITHEQILSADSIGINYARVLAFNSKGRKILHSIKNSSDIPVIIKIPDYQSIMRNDIRATNLRSLTLPAISRFQQDFFQSPIFVEE